MAYLLIALGFGLAGGIVGRVKAAPSCSGF